MDIKRSLGIGVRMDDPQQRERILRYINLKLASMGLPVSDVTDANDIELAHDLIENFKEKNKKTYIKGKRIYARIRRKHTTPKPLAREVLKEQHIKEKVRSANVK